MSASQEKGSSKWSMCNGERFLPTSGLRMSGIQRSLANTEVLFHQRGDAPHPRSHSWVCHKYMMNRVRLVTNSNYILTTNNLAPALLMGFPSWTSAFPPPFHWHWPIREGQVLWLGSWWKEEMERTAAYPHPSERRRRWSVSGAHNLL